MDKLLTGIIGSYYKNKIYFLNIRDNESYAIDSVIKKLLVNKNKIGIWLCKAFIYIYLIDCINIFYNSINKYYIEIMSFIIYKFLIV